MKVCIITPFFNEYPNAMASAIKLADGLANQHYDVTVYTSQTYNAAKTEQLKNITIHRLPAWYIPEPANYVFTRGLIRALWKEHKTTDIFIINKYMWPVSWSILFLKLWRKKVIVIVDAFQGYDWWSWSKYVNAIMWLYARTIGKFILRSADRVILLHEGLEKRAKQLQLRYQVIHNGIDPKRFQTAMPAEDIVNPSKITVTYIGRLDRIKGYLDFLNVAQHITKKRSDVQYIIVGNTTNRDAVIKKYSSPNIHFTGVRKDIPAILSASNILVLPTYGDGLPNVIIEAMAAGLPCIGTNINGLPYLIEDHRTGLLFTPGDTKMLQQHIEYLLDHEIERHQYGKAGQLKVNQEFNYEHIVKQYDILFKTLLP